MRARGLILLLLFIAAVLALFFVFRPETQAAFGPAVALCPGPDLYGYTCASGAGFAYIDATNDTLLYEDDGMTSLELPFPFTFYGTVYSEVQASSNGNLQFANSNAFYRNDCLATGPVPDMGDMIAPYWDDLDLRFYGYLEYEIAGATPNRIFVLEWDDIPRFGDNSDDRVTFAVQLFEGSNDIVFLYEDVTTLEGHNGSSATIGLQSETQELALQFGCNQPVVANAGGIYFPHPPQANDEVGLDTVFNRAEAPITMPAAKGHVAELITLLTHRGPAALLQLRTHWLNQTPPRASEWQSLDLTGDGRPELLLLWHGGPQQPQLAQVVVLTEAEAGRPVLLFDQRLSTRQSAVNQLAILATADLTGDTRPDAVLHDEVTGQLFVVTAASGRLELLSVPERCRGSLGVFDHDSDGLVEIIRDGCDQGQGRVIYAWNGREFAALESNLP